MKFILLWIAMTGHQSAKQQIDLAALLRQNQLLVEQNQLLRQMIPAPPKQHNKFVRVILRTLPVVDHVGSVASIVSVLGIAKSSKY